MDLLIAPVPLFDGDMAVQAYHFLNRRGNDMLDGTGTSHLDGAMVSPALEMMNRLSMEALTMGKPIFVPINRYMLLGRLETQSRQPADRIVFLIDGSEIESAEPYVENVARLKGLGYRFGLRDIDDAARFAPILERCDFIFYDHRSFDSKGGTRLRIAVGHSYSGIVSVYTNIGTSDLFNDLRSRYKGLFEGPFYRTPLTRGRHGASPLQVNLINLLNTVRDENFEFDSVAEVIQRDPALTVSLLRLVNSAYFALKEKVKSINQAVVMLGQTETRKWITTAVAKLLGAEKPSEVTRLSLIRAKFAEGLAKKFGMEKEAQSLFLMGLFSVLDAILDMPIDEALDLVRVSDDIYAALVRREGRYAHVYQFMLDYEAANWNAVSRALILNDLPTSDIYEAYMGAMTWYSDIVGGDE